MNAQQSSRVITLIEQTGQFTLDPPTAIAQDLLLFNTNPCLLFIRWSSEPNAVINEALSISFSSRVTAVVESLKSYLESVRVEGDAVLSSKMSDWYQAMGSELKKANRRDYLFDPTVVVVGVMKHLVTSLETQNHLDVTSEPILIPLCFVRRWAFDFAEAIRNDENSLRCYASIVVA